VTFPLNAYLLAGCGAGVTTLVTLPVWRKWCRGVGLVDAPGRRKIHEVPIPLAGGLAVFTGILAPLLVAGVALAWPSIWREHSGQSGLPFHMAFDAQTIERLSYGFGRRGLQLAAILAGAVGMVVLGWLDDKHELRPAVKFTGQLLIAALVAGAGVRITLFVPSVIFSYAITILWILTVTNAFNFMDNMNGLCAGLGAIGAGTLAGIAAGHGQYLVASLALLTTGSLLGFLPYNFPKATAFLGDAGSHLVGFLLAVLAILPHFYSKKNPDAWAVLTPLLVLAVPLLDLAWVVILRWRIGQPFYVGDTNHLSHRLVRRGWSRTRAVAVIWGLGALAGGLACLL
jgi:UDP-GlcNAc:undecaprenyl-phosphate GlcNAc-1-phosphate transferase